MTPIRTFLPGWLLALAIIALTPPPLPAAPAETEESPYGYPYTDPYLATSTIAIMKGRDESRPNDTIRNLEIPLVPGRDAVPLLEGKGKLHFRLYRSSGKAPLVIIIPGLGSSAYEGSASYIAELLVASGFHVMVMPDPLNWNFALAASTSGYPGHHRADAADMYRAMQVALRYVLEHEPITVGKIGLMGFSEGALCAAYVDTLDAQQQLIEFDTTLLVNPPVDTLVAVRKIDAMAQLGQTLSATQREQVYAYAFGTGIRALKQDYDDPDYFVDWDRRLRMTQVQVKYLIGAALFSAVGDTMYTIEQAQAPGVLKTPVSADFRTARLEEARSLGLMGFVERFLLPRLRADDPRIDLQTLNDSTSLKAIAPALAKSRRVFLMHNRDDILLSPGDIPYLERLFKERASIYPVGGHLGNLWYPPNKRDIVAHFRHYLGANRWLEDLF